MLAPTSLIHVNSVISNSKFAISPQTSELPLSISSGVMLAKQLPSNWIVISWQTGSGLVVSSIVNEEVV